MTDEDDSDESPVGENDARDGSNPPSDDERPSTGTDAADSSATSAADSDATDADGADATDASETAADSSSENDAATVPDETERSPDDDGGGFLSNLTSPREQLGEAAAAFKNARGASGLPQDEEGRVKLVCRRYAERRAVPLDDVGRPSCYEKGHPDCEGCLEDVRDGTVETF